MSRTRHGNYHTFARCLSERDGKRCRLTMIAHVTDDGGREVHKYWNGNGFKKWWVDTGPALTVQNFPKLRLDSESNTH